MDIVTYAFPDPLEQVPSSIANLNHIMTAIAIVNRYLRRSRNQARRERGEPAGTNVDFALKSLDFVLKCLDFVLKMFDFALKMLDFCRSAPGPVMGWACSHWQRVLRISIEMAAFSVLFLLKKRPFQSKFAERNRNRRHNVIHGMFI